MNAYGDHDKMNDYLRLRPNTVVNVTNFELKSQEHNVKKLYHCASNLVYGVINSSGSVRERGPNVRDRYSLDEVMTHLGLFTLLFIGSDPEDFNPACGPFINSFWMTGDNQEVEITAYREMIPALTGFQEGETYIIENCVPWPSSRQHANHFTVGTLTTFTNVDE